MPKSSFHKCKSPFLEGKLRSTHSLSPVKSLKHSPPRLSSGTRSSWPKRRHLFFSSTTWKPVHPSVAWQPWQHSFRLPPDSAKTRGQPSLFQFVPRQPPRPTREHDSEDKTVSFKSVHVVIFESLQLTLLLGAGLCLCSQASFTCNHNHKCHQTEVDCVPRRHRGRERVSRAKRGSCLCLAGPFSTSLPPWHTVLSCGCCCCCSRLGQAFTYFVRLEHGYQPLHPKWP